MSSVTDPDCGRGSAAEFMVMSIVGIRPETYFVNMAVAGWDCFIGDCCESMVVTVFTALPVDSASQEFVYMLFDASAIFRPVVENGADFGSAVIEIAGLSGGVKSAAGFCASAAAAGLSSDWIHKKCFLSVGCYNVIYVQESKV